MTNGLHGHKKSADVYNAKMGHFLYEKHDFPNWKCELNCCAKCKSIAILGQKSNKYDKDIYPMIYFHVYIVLSHFTVYSLCPFEEDKTCVTQFQQQKQMQNYTHKDILCQ